MFFKIQNSKKKKDIYCFPNQIDINLYHFISLASFNSIVELECYQRWTRNKIY